MNICILLGTDDDVYMYVNGHAHKRTYNLLEGGGSHTQWRSDYGPGIDQTHDALAHRIHSLSLSPLSVPPHAVIDKQTNHRSVYQFVVFVDFVDHCRLDVHIIGSRSKTYKAKAHPSVTGTWLSGRRQTSALPCPGNLVTTLFPDDVCVYQ
jgi:hypothetical protein